MESRDGQSATEARRHRPLRNIIVVALALAASGLGLFWYLDRPARKATVAQHMTNKGYAEWQRGNFQMAEVSFQSAAQMDPGNLRPTLLLGRMWLSTPDRERGRELFARLLGSTKDPLRTTILANYHDALVCVGWWDELARLAVGELAAAGDANPLWLDSALAALRLGRSAQHTAEKLPGWDRLDARSSGLLRTQLAINQGDAPQARALLATVSGPFTPLLSLSVARLHLRAGNGTGARLALAMTDTPLSQSEILLGEILVSRQSRELLREAVNNLLTDSAAFSASPGNAELMVGILLQTPDRDIAEQVGGVFAKSPQNSSDSLAAALLIYCSLSGADRARATWTRVIEQRAGASTLRIPAGKLDQRTALFLINSFPLTRDMVVAVLDAIDETRLTATAAP